ncbi:MAG: hypothetical protein WA970_08710 [Gammaproteobacteria bacterium]
MKKLAISVGALAVMLAGSASAIDTDNGTKAFCEGESVGSVQIDPATASIEAALADCLSQCNELYGDTTEFGCVTQISTTFDPGAGDISADQSDIISDIIKVEGLCLRSSRCPSQEDFTTPSPQEELPTQLPSQEEELPSSSPDEELPPSSSEEEQSMPLFSR